MLQVEKLTKRYGKRPVLQAVTFELAAGEVIGLVGPNGAGKSTLMRSILALEEVDEGTVSVQGVSNQSPEFFRYVSFLPSDNYLYMHLSGYDHLAFVANVYGLDKTAIEEVIDSIGIRSYVNDPVKTYSYGMRQHLLIALSILTKPIVILMDEPFNGLDPTSIIELKQLIRDLSAQEIGILVSTHNLDILEDMTKAIWFIKEGELIQTNIGLVDKVSYQIDVQLGDGQTVDQLMADSNLPFHPLANALTTDPAFEVELYLEQLIKNGAKIQAVQQSTMALEEKYKEFYGLNT
ncbi:ABC transporter ATP-binding protein [Sporosarcina saromensis]|uniref:ABC transporter ATP-binding protein n=1 Tax=Sporosarcina saromensis TaxID=359365 RepID=A0ABU4G920_9BACL|nr:ABC transporter ATP-binding protein [Sporosarcina saromensis]MDW0113463.1 ABC transporter ATP-binding protein [Sporosarcina saromensis]